MSIQVGHDNFAGPKIAKPYNKISGKSKQFLMRQNLICLLKVYLSQQIYLISQNNT